MKLLLPDIKDLKECLPANDQNMGAKDVQNAILKHLISQGYPVPEELGPDSIPEFMSNVSVLKELSSTDLLMRFLPCDTLKILIPADAADNLKKHYSTSIELNKLPAVNIPSELSDSSCQSSGELHS